MMRTSGGRLALTLCVAMSAAFLEGQELQRAVSRERDVDVDGSEAWQRILNLAKESFAIVNTADSGARLIGFTLPLTPMDVRQMATEGKDLDEHPQMAHVTVWARPEDAGTRVFVRATIGRAGVFAHSSGLLERQILDAIQLRTPWRKSERDTVKDFSQPADDVWTAARDALRDSESVIVNAEDARARVITCSFSIPSNTFRQYTSARVDDYVPGAAHLTVWVEPTAKGARIRARALMHEFDSLAPTALASSGKLEAAVVAATTTRLDGENASVAGASTYRGKPDFLAALFQPPRTADAQDVWKQELPASAERVWIAALKVVTQSSIVVQSDRATGLVRFITAHASDAPAKYSVHQVELRMLSSQLGTTLTVTGNADEPSQEMVADRRLVVERIAAELFVKERLGWLFQDAGAVK